MGKIFNNISTVIIVLAVFAFGSVWLIDNVFIGWWNLFINWVTG